MLVIKIDNSDVDIATDEQSIQNKIYTSRLVWSSNKWI